MGNGHCLKIRTPCGQNTAAGPLTLPFQANLSPKTKSTPRGNLSLKETPRRFKHEPLWVKGTYFSLGGIATTSGIAMSLQNYKSRLSDGLGVGLMSSGLASLTLDLLTETTGGKPMPRWARLTLSLGFGVFAGTMHTFFGHFDAGGLPGNPQRNPTDEYGP